MCSGIWMVRRWGSCRLSLCLMQTAKITNELQRFATRCRLKGTHLWCRTSGYRSDLKNQMTRSFIVTDIKQGRWLSLQVAKFSKWVQKARDLTVSSDLLQVVNLKDEIRFDLIRIGSMKNTLGRKIWFSILAGKLEYKYADWRSKLVLSMMPVAGVESEWVQSKDLMKE